MTWRHARWFCNHKPKPDLSKAYVQGGTGNTEAPCLTCGEVVVNLRVAGPHNSKEEA